MLALGIALSLALSGCSARATFYSKTGAVYSALVPRAVRCDEGEAQAVVDAGGVAIGTIAAKSLRADTNNDDLWMKAMREAGKRGGTHVVLTEKGVDTFTVSSPAQVLKSCTRDRHSYECEKTYIPPSEETYERPTAKFVVFRVPPEAWGKLPDSLRPAP